MESQWPFFRPLAADDTSVRLSWTDIRYKLTRGGREICKDSCPLMTRRRVRVILPRQDKASILRVYIQSAKKEEKNGYQKFDSP